MVVCHCAGVNEARILDEIAEGVSDLDEVAERCGAGRDCGGCRPTVQRLLEQFGLGHEPAAA
jgi:bacterioferritin-associated ferredoxin